MNTPARLSAEFLAGAGVTESLQSRVIAALRFLSFVDEDERPTDTLRDLVVAPDDEFRRLLEVSVRRAYADDFANVDPGVDPQPRILSAFQRYQPRSQHDRQVMLFLGLCREAGIPVLDAPRERGMQDSSKKSRGPSRGGSHKPPPEQVAKVPTTSASPHEENSPALFGLVGLVERDAELLDETEFEEVWQALGTVVGKIARARARARVTSTPVTEEAALESRSDG
jgi:hypothetical protein